MVFKLVNNVNMIIFGFNNGAVEMMIPISLIVLIHTGEKM